jgi:hypothetical protein
MGRKKNHAAFLTPHPGLKKLRNQPTHGCTVGYFLDAAPRLAKIALVAGAFGVTVSAAMKMLSAKAKMSLLELGSCNF